MPLIKTAAGWVMVSISLASFGIPAGVQVFATPGSFTYTPSAGTRAVLVEVQAAGGGGTNYAPGNSTAPASI